MNKLFNFIIFSMLLFSHLGYSQGIDLQLEDATNCNDYSYCVTIQIKGSQGSPSLQIGSSSMLMTYDERVLSYKNYTSLQFDGTGQCQGWAAHQVDGNSIPGKFDLTLTLTDNSDSCPSLGDATYENVGIVCFDILQQGASPDVSFDIMHTNFNRNQPDNGTNPIAVATVPHLDVAGTLVCDCPGSGSPCDDNNVYTVNDQYDTYCDCKGTYEDADNDGILDGIDPCLDQILEAENAIVVGAQIKNNQAQYIGTGFVDYKSNHNNYVEFSVSTTESGDHTFSFRYALSSGNRPMELSIDGVVIDESFDFPSTDSWTNWEFVEITHDLSPGTHTVKLRTNGNNGPNLDQMIFSFCTDCTQSGLACDDGDPCTTEDVYDANCNCAGKYEDTDDDGICNTADICEGSDDNQDNDNDGTPDGCDDCDNSTIGTACDDGDPCTINDVYDANCDCAGTFSGADADQDGVCDSNDICPGGDDNLDSDGDGTPDFCDACDDRTVGKPCDDGDPCTILDSVTADCGCFGIFIDSDGDGVCNSLDQCEGHDDNADMDGDGIPDACDPCDNNLAGTPCNDGNNCTINDVYDADCNCVGTFEDTDADGVCDARDLCEGFDDNLDADGDAIPDDCDDCSDDVYQAEDAYLSGPLVKSSGYGYAGTGFADVRNNNGDSLVFTIDIQTAGAYWMSFRYALKNGSRPMELQIDGVVVNESFPFPKTYNWNIWERSGMYVEFEVGTHTVQLTSNGANGPNIDHLGLCYEVLDPISISLSGTDNLCNGAEEGTVTTSASGGTNTFTFNWSNGAITGNLEGLSAGTYELTATDALGYSATASITIGEPTALNISENVTNANDADGAIDLSTSGGVSPYTYAWSNAATSEDLAGLIPGRYKVTVTDANACTAVKSISVYPSDLCLDNIYQAEDAQVSGPQIKTQNFGFTGSGYADFKNSSGDQIIFTIDIAQEGAHYLEFRYALKSGSRNMGLEIDGVSSVLHTPKTGSWTNWGSVGLYHEFTVGTHTIILSTTGANGGNFDFLSVCHEVLDPISIDINSTNVLCNGAPQGSIVATVSGGTNSFTYNWSNGATTPELENLSAGTYELTATDALGYSQTTSIEITEPSAIEIAESVSNTADADGAIDLSVSGGLSPYTFNWSNSSTSEDLAGLIPGRYKVTVTDANACTATKSISVFPSDLCLDNIYQAEDAQVTGAQIKTQHFGFTGNGYVDFKNNSGDQLTFTIDIEEAGAHYLEFRYVMRWNNRYMGLEIDGVSSVLHTPKTGNTWTSWGSVGLYHEFTVGTHTVVLSTTGDNGGNFDFLSVCHEELDPISIEINTTDVLCNGAAEGSAVATVSGGTNSFSYNWSNGTTTEENEGLTSGSYTLTATDALGYSQTATININEPDALGTSISITNSSGNDGAIDLTINGGVSPFAYNWSNGETSEDLDHLSAGRYKLTVTDANACTLTDKISVYPSDMCLDNVYQAEEAQIFGPLIRTTHFGFTENGYVDFKNSNGDSLVFDIDIAQAGVHYLNFRYALKSGNRNMGLEIDGESSVLHTPKTGNSWTNWSSVGVYHEFTVGSHTVILTSTGAHPGNFDFLSVCHVELDPISIAFESVNVSCNEGTDGSALAIPSGGTGNHIYSWENGATSEGIEELTQGTYAVTVSDELGNSSTGSITIEQPSALALSDNVTDASCFGGLDGNATVAGSGGTGNINYSWNNGQNGATIEDILAGTYTVTAIDENGCTTSSDITIGEPEPLSINATATPSGQNDGTLSVSAVGGVGGYTYSWSNGANTALVEGLAPGTYGVTVSDANWCSVTNTYVVHPTPQMESGTVAAVSDTWQTVNLNNSYGSMVVVATLVLPDDATLPAVTRVRNANGNSFELKVQNPGEASLGDYTVHYFVVEEGIYTLEENGVKMEAKKVLSIQTAYKNSWILEPRTYQNNYTSPVVIGQVMTDNDPLWSVFWASRNNTRSVQPKSSGFAAGKHVAEDSNTTRADETIGYIVLESGNYELNGFSLQAGVGGDNIQGVDNSASGYQYSLNLANATRAVVSSAAMDGNDGGWTSLFGAEATFADLLTLTIDEDQISDTERSHTTEQVAYVAFEFPPPTIQQSNLINPTVSNATEITGNKAEQTKERSTLEEEEQPVTALKVHPNPVSDILSIQTKLEGTQAVDLWITDVNGKRILQRDLNTAASGWLKTQLDLNTLRDGIYLLHVKGDAEIRTEKFVKITP